MFLNCLLLIGLIAIAIVIDKELWSKDQAEFALVPVRVDETKNLKNLR
ncbi:MAG: hypothetical protein AB4368_28505 [Xenococcaceae cyanobacterium]